MLNILSLTKFASAVFQDVSMIWCNVVSVSLCFTKFKKKKKKKKKNAIILLVLP